MAYTLDEKLSRLRGRRYDPSVLQKATAMNEAYQKRSSNKATQYALGIMQEVDPRSTEISVEEAAKVEEALSSGLSSVFLKPTFKLQGSVPANVHIKGVSDVDLLCIEGTYLQAEPCSDGFTTYTDYSGRGTITDDILYLRRQAELVLNRRYWAAEVDTSHDKSIALSGGGFRRKVDVVPSSWYDTVDYQRSLKESYRGVDIVNKSSREKIRNYPFWYIEQLNNADIATNGGTKMGTRLLKNLKNDSETEIALSSYDLGSLMYHCPASYVAYSREAELSVLAGVDKWFSELATSETEAKKLTTPDGTRQILDSQDKWLSIGSMSSELSELSRAVATETDATILYMGRDRSYIRDHLRANHIPWVA